MDITIRKLPIVESPELDLITDFSYILFRQMWGCNDKEHFSDYLKELLTRSETKLFVAYSHLAPVGFVFYDKVSDDSRDEVYIPALACAGNGTKFIEGSKAIGMIGVSPHHWRRKIGSSLLDTILADAQSDEVSQLYASCINGTTGPSC
jgi:ribosomal protein S18 acetylase RimI-like enzyme